MSSLKALSAAVVFVASLAAYPSFGCEGQSLDDARKVFSGDGHTFVVHAITDKRDFTERLYLAGASPDFIAAVIPKTEYLAVGRGPDYPARAATIGFFDDNKCIITAVNVTNISGIVPKRVGFDI